MILSEKVNVMDESSLKEVKYDMNGG